MSDRNAFAALLLITLALAGCTQWMVTAAPPSAPAAPIPPAANENAPPPEISAVPRIVHPMEERALVWVYPLGLSQKDGEMLAEKVQSRAKQQGVQWLAPMVRKGELPTPNQLPGGQLLAQAGVGYVVVPHYETGPAGFFTMEMYRPPDPALIWVTSFPLADHRGVGKAMDHAFDRMIQQLSRNVRQASITLVSTGWEELPATAEPEGATWEVQTGAYLVLENANDAAGKLRQRGYQPTQQKVRDSMDRLWNVVRIGQYPTRERATAFKETFEKKEHLPAYVTPAGRF